MNATQVESEKKPVEEVEKVEDDWFILEYDPDESSFDLSSLSKCLDEDVDSTFVEVVADQGQISCRDFPHSRYHCVQYPMSMTPSEKLCKLCYCFICDVVAPCTEWSEHCHATQNHANYDGLPQPPKVKTLVSYWECLSTPKQSS